MGPDAMILAFWMLSFKPAFLFSSFTFVKKLFSSSLLSAYHYTSMHKMLNDYVKEDTIFMLFLSVSLYFLF